MKIDESYFKGVETDDSTVERPAVSRDISDYGKTFTVAIDCGTDAPNINEANRKCSAMLETLKHVREYSEVEISEQNSFDETEAVYKIGINIVPETPYNVISALSRFVSAIMTSGGNYSTYPHTVTVSGFGEDRSEEISINNFSKLIRAIPEFRDKYDRSTQSNTFVFKERKERQIMKKMTALIEDYIETASAEPETVASDISRYFCNVTPIVS